MRLSYALPLHDPCASVGRACRAGQGGGFGVHGFWADPGQGAALALVETLLGEALKLTEGDGP